MDSTLTDPGAERAVLAGLLSYGMEAYVDVSDFLSPKSFTHGNNAALYKCIEKMMIDGMEVDVSSIQAAATQLKLIDVINNAQELDYIKTLMQFAVNKSNVFKYAVQVKKYEFARSAKKVASTLIRDLENITGDESIDELINMIENPIGDLLREDSTSKTPTLLGEDIDDFVQDRIDNKCDQMGIPTGYARYDAAIGGGLRRGGVELISARPKALRHGSKVYTSTGSINIEDVKVGDTVKHPFRGDTTVTAVWPHKDKDIYRLHFRDGDYVDCCEDHIWHVTKSHGNKNEFLKTTKELKNDIRVAGKFQYKWNVCLPDPIEFRTQDIPLDPYFIGVLLGDGSVSNNSCVYHTADDEIHYFMSTYAQSLGYEVKIDSNDPNNKCTSYRINSIQGKIRESGIWGKNCYNKRIPQKYIYNSKGVRLGILAGLLDTDGDCTVDPRSKQSRIRFCSVSHGLCLDVKEIVQSLGGLCSINKSITTREGKEFESYRCEIRLPQGVNPFRLKRKSEKFTGRMIGPLKRTITKIEKVGVDSAVCLTLSDDDGLFMTDNYVVTHNTGKSVFALNTSLHVAKRSIPVLLLDTEMSKEDQIARNMANMTGVAINDVATGKFSENKESLEAIWEASKEVRDLPIHYINVSGEPIENILNLIKRWIIRTVGVDENGRTNDCVVIYDYLKLTSGDSLNASIQEYQALGFQITSLHNMAVKYDFPCLALTQLNRDGITSESTASISGSDRLIWLCTSFSIFKLKSPEEIAEDGPNAGNRKLVPIVSRHGAGMQDGNYINMNMLGEYARLLELPTRDEIRDIRSNTGAIDGAEDYEGEE